MKLSKLTAAISIALFSSAIHANTQLDKLVISANKTEQSIESVTSMIHIITAEEIEAKHYQTALEAISKLAGISFTQNGSIGMSSNVFLRGSDNKRILFLIDGIRINNPSSTNGAAIEHIPTANIERIEIVKGAQSGVWGSDAAAGVINIITKTNTRPQINLEYGSYNTKKVSAQGTVKTGKGNLTLSLQKIETDGFSSYVPSGDDVDNYEKDGYENTSAMAKFSTSFMNGGNLTMSHNHTSAINDYDAEYQNPNSPGTSDSRTDLTSIQYIFDNTTVALKQSLFDSKQTHSEYTDRIEGRTQSVDVTQQYNNLLFGLGYTHNETDSEKPSYTYPAPTYIKTYQGQNIQNASNDTKSIYLTHHHKHGALLFNEALRWDNYSNFDSIITGKLGVKAIINKQSFVTANYGTAYNAPSIIQILNPWGISNPDLEPERSRDVDLGYTYSDFNVTLFKKSVDNLIDWHSSQFQNVEGTTEILGLEASYQHSWNSVDLITNIARVETQKEDGSNLARRPETEASVDVTWYASDHLDFNVNAQYIGARSEEAYTQFYTVVNSVINYQINKDLNAYLKLNNVFDTYYQVVDNYGAQERSAYLGVNAQF